MADNTIQLAQQTEYPWEGKVTISVNPEKEDEFIIRIRIPGWALGSPLPSDLYRYENSSAEEPRLSVNGQAVALQLDHGFVALNRTWKKGDRIELELPMPIRKVVAHDSVKADAGKLALERGPIVYCAEWVDNGGHVLNLMLPKDAELRAEHRPDLLNGVTVLTGQAVALSSTTTGIQRRIQDFVAIPYYAWAHRGAGEMTVWLPYQESAARAISFTTVK